MPVTGRDAASGEPSVYAEDCGGKLGFSALEDSLVEDGEEKKKSL